MTHEEFIAKLECHKRVLQDSQPLLIAVQSINAQRSERIFTDGLNSAGGKIGTYNDTNPLYVNPRKAPSGFTPRGKNEKRSKKAIVGGKRLAVKPDLTERKTRFFESYKDFRQAVGRESGFVNLNLFGNLKSNFENSRIIKISDNEYQMGLDDLNAKKLEGHEEHYGEIRTHTQEEIDSFFSIQGKEFQNALSKC